MNSYPPEFVNHHFPLMLVAGLGTGPNPASEPSAATTTPASGSGASSGSVPSKGTLTPASALPTLCKDLAEIFTARGRNTLWDPARGGAAVFHSVLVDKNTRLPPRKSRPVPRSSASANSTTSASLPTDSASAPSSTSDVAEATTAAAAALPARSPLSPLHPGSPLFPDGMIAPIWVRKHRELVPSVFVAFHLLSEPAPGVAGNASSAANTSEPAERQALGASTAVGSIEELRQRDEELIQEIAERKRALVERGIKLTVVLLTNRTMLENPQLEPRLSHVRRASGLDSKASLFVLTPVSRGELNEFVTSLQRALYDAALDFYREHSRRVRRKRSRYPPPPSVFQPILNAARAARGLPPDDSHPPAVLSREGWVVRAEYKLGTFAELRGEREAALAHYSEAYTLLSDVCLGSTVLLPPRTKRWAEAKVLADTLSMRIAKFCLYDGDGERAVNQFRRHLVRFSELSTGWGIGDETFEYWSWLSKQYRAFGDLVETATRAVPSGHPLPPFQLPSHMPNLPSSLLHPALAAGTTSTNGVNAASGQASASGVAPALQIEESGTYFYLAALCTVERRDRFRKIVAAEGESSEGSSGLPALMHERKVDHAAQITELYTRAYETFKRAKQHRTALMIASKIAQVYSESDQHEMALRFLERIARTYRRERWSGVLAALLLPAFECAQQIDDVEAASRTLLEILCPSLPVSSAQRVEAERSLRQLLDTKSLPEEKKPLVLATGASDGLFALNTVFWKASVDIGAAAPFQLRLTASDNCVPSSLTFSKLRIHFEELVGIPPVIVRHRTADGEREPFDEIVSLGRLESAKGDSHAETWADLRWRGGTVKAFQGTVFSRTSGELRIARVELIVDGAVPLGLTFASATVEPLSPPSESSWLIRTRPDLSYVRLQRRDDPGSTNVRRHTHKLAIEFVHRASPYLDESFPIEVRINNEDQEDFECSVDLLLRPAYEGADDVVSCGEQSSSSTLRNIPLGKVAAGGSGRTTVSLYAKHEPGPRSLEIVVHSAPSSTAHAQDSGVPAASEIVRALVLPVRRAFVAEHNATWKHTQSSEQGNSAFLAFEDEKEEDGEALDPIASGSSLRLETGLCFVGLEAVRVEKVALKLDPAARHLRIAEMDASADEDLAGDWEPQDRFAAIFNLGVDRRHQESVEVSGQLEVGWRRLARENAEQPTLNTTRLPLPVLIPPLDSIHVIVSPPALAYLDMPFTLSMTVTNSHPFFTADLVLALDPTEAFAFAGPRQQSIPVILPGQSRKILLSLVPAMCGRAVLPRLRVWDRRHRRGRPTVEQEKLDLERTSEDVPVPVLSDRGGIGTRLTVLYGRGGESPIHPLPEEEGGSILTVLVLPSRD